MQMIVCVSPLSCTVKMDAPLLAAIHLLNEQKHGFAFLVVVDNSGRLVGTLTDGDIRRSLVQAKDITGLVADFMFCDPIYGDSQQSEEELEELFNLISAPNLFLPIPSP